MTLMPCLLSFVRLMVVLSLPYGVRLMIPPALVKLILTPFLLRSLTTTMPS